MGLFNKIKTVFLVLILFLGSTLSLGINTREVKALNANGYGFVTDSNVGGVNFGQSGASTLSFVHDNNSPTNFSLHIKVPQSASNIYVELSIPSSLTFNNKGTISNSAGSVSNVVYDGITLANTDIPYSSSKVTYNINPDTTEATISGSISASNSFWPQAFDDEIKADIYYDYALQETVTINGFTIDGTHPLDGELGETSFSNIMNNPVSTKPDEFNSTYFTYQYIGQVAIKSLSFEIHPTSMTSSSGNIDATKVEFSVANADESDYKITPKLGGVYLVEAKNNNSTNAFRLNGIASSLKLGFLAKSGDYADGDTITYDIKNYKIVGFGDNNRDITIRDIQQIGAFKINVKGENIQIQRNAINVSISQVDDMAVKLGSVQIRNEGASSQEKEVIYRFDNINANVKSLDLFVPMKAVSETNPTNINSVTTINYKCVDKNGVEQVGAFNPSTPIDSGRALSVVDLGLTNEDSITEIRYTLKSIPNMNDPRDINIYGVAKQTNVNLNNSIEIVDLGYDASNSNLNKTTGKVPFQATVNSKLSAVIFSSIGSPVAINSGQSMNKGVKISPSMEYDTYVKNPTVYLRNDSSVKINLENLRVINNLGQDVEIISPEQVASGAVKDNKVIISKIAGDVGSTEVYKLDMSNFTDGSMSVYQSFKEDGKMSSKNIEIQYQIDTELFQETHTQALKDFIFVLDETTDPEVEFVNDISVFPQTRGDRYNLAVGSANSGEMLSPTYSNAYEVNATKDLVVVSSSKLLNDADDKYQKYEDINSGVVMSDTTAIHRVQLINTSGKQINEALVYIPIPKEGEKWGGLQASTFEFDLKLAEAIVNNYQNFDILYGQGITPSDNFTEIDNERLSSPTLWSDTFDSNANYNCVLIKATNVLFDNNTDLAARQAANTRSFMLKLTATSIDSTTDKINTYATLMNADLSDSVSGAHKIIRTNNKVDQKILRNIYGVTYSSNLSGYSLNTTYEQVINNNKPQRVDDVPAKIIVNGRYYSFKGWTKDNGTDLISTAALRNTAITADTTFAANFEMDEKVRLTITGKNVSVDYDGSVQSVSGHTLTGSLIGTDVIQVVDSVSGKGVGLYPMNITFSIANNNIDTSESYDVTVINGSLESKNKPQLTPSAAPPSIAKKDPVVGRSCQDDGYPVGYYWSESENKCVVRSYVVPKTSTNNMLKLNMFVLLVSLASLYLYKKKD